MKKSMVIILGAILLLTVVFIATNTQPENKTMVVQKPILQQKDDFVEPEKVVLKKEIKIKASTDKKIIKGYTQAHEYLYKKKMKQIVDDVQFTKNNTPFTIYSDGEDSTGNELTPPVAPVSVTTSLEEGAVSFFVPSNATQIALLIANGDDQKLVVESINSKNAPSRPPSPAVSLDESYMPETEKP